MNTVTENIPSIEVTADTETSSTPVANFNPLVDKVTQKFGFRTVKDETTGLESKRPTVELDLELVSVEGIVKIFDNGGKELDLLIEAVRKIQIDRARDIVSEKEDVSQDNFPMDQISWSAIANLPKAERRGGGISKEIWEEFAKDYCLVMPGLTGKKPEQIANASKIFLSKFQSVKTAKPILKLLRAQLAIYANSSPRAEEFGDCITFLDEKATGFINLDDASLLANL